MPANKFKQVSPSINQPTEDWQAVVPSDDDDLPFVPRAISVNSGGDVTILSAAGNEATIAMADAEMRPVRPVRIKAAGTTATGIVIYE